MNITRKQRNVIWLSVFLLGGIYYAPHIVSSARTMSQSRTQAAMARQEVGAYHAPPAAAPARKQAFFINGIDPDDRGTTTRFFNLRGAWRGGAALPTGGPCMLNLEIRFSQQKLGEVNGYSTMTCANSLALLSHPAANPNVLQQVLRANSPVSTIMTGSVSGDTIHFHVDTHVGASHDGCVMSSLDVTPFGVKGIAVQWQSSPLPTPAQPVAQAQTTPAQSAACEGGDMVMERTP